MMKIGDKLTTPHGPGTVCGWDHKGCSSERIGVKLDNPEGWVFSAHGEIPYYFKHELNKGNRKQWNTLD